MGEHVQRNLRGDPVLPHRLRDMVHTMREMERAQSERPSPHWPHFSADGCAAAGEWDYGDAEAILAELEGLGLVEQIPEHDPGSYRTTSAGHVWLDEQLALVGIPAFDSPEYRNAGKVQHG